MMARRNRSKSLRDSFVYELRSVNLTNLPEKEQGAVLDGFASFLDSLTEPITFHIVQDEREVEAVGALYQIPYKRFFVETHSQVDSLVLKLGTRITRVHAIPSIKMAGVHPKYIVDSEGRYVQTYCITRLGGTLVPGFLAELYQIAHSIMVDVDPIDIYDAKKIAKSYAKSVGSRLVLRQTEGRSLDPEEQAEFQRASGAAQLIGVGKERLFRTRIRIVLRATSYEGLVDAQKEAEAARRRDGRPDRLSGVPAEGPPDRDGPEVCDREVVPHHDVRSAGPLPVLRAGRGRPFGRFPWPEPADGERDPLRRLREGELQSGHDGDDRIWQIDAREDLPREDA